MSKKNYEQRLKERWKRKQQRDEYVYNLTGGFSNMRDVYAATAWIMPFLFGKRNR